MSSKVKVSKIVLVVNGKEIELTIDEAKELNGMLGELFDQKEKTIVVERHPYIPYSYPYVYVKPYVWEQPYITWCGHVTFSGNTSTLTLTNLSETITEY